MGTRVSTCFRYNDIEMMQGAGKILYSNLVCQIIFHEFRIRLSSQNTGAR